MVKRTVESIGPRKTVSALHPMSAPKLFVTATISQDCTRENGSSLLIALKGRPRELKVKSSGFEEGDRKRIRLR